MPSAHVYALPFPPSLNRIWRAVAGRLLLSEQARQYLPRVVNALPMGRIVPLTGRLAVLVALHPPHKLAREKGRRWDVMNREKLLCDCLTKAKVWLDDSQIDDFRVMRMGVLPAAPEGCAWVHITELDEPLTNA